MRFLLCLTALVGCGSSIDAKRHIGAVCQAAGVVQTTEDLVSLDLKLDPPERAMQVNVRPDVWLVAYQTALDAAEMQEMVRSHRSDAKAIAERTGNTRSNDDALVVIDQAAASKRVTDTLAALQRTGVTKVHFVVASTQPHVLPAYPDPAFAAEFKVELANANPAHRQSMAAKRISEEISLCPGAQQTFAAVATASPEQRCTLIAHGMGEALPSCYLTSTSRVVTAMHVLSEPTTDTQLTQFSLTLAADAEPLALSGATWAEAAKPLSAMAGKTFNALPVLVEPAAVPE